MSAMDLNRIAVAMGKVLKLLSELESNLKNGDDIYERKEDCYLIAYICRKGILDRIENNTYMLNPLLPIRIPTGLFSFKKETMTSALSITVGKLKEIVSRDYLTKMYVEEILNKEKMFYEFERIVPDNLKNSL